MLNAHLKAKHDGKVAARRKLLRLHQLTITKAREGSGALLLHAQMAGAR